MKQIKLGNHGPLIPTIGLGCMNLAGAFGKTDETTSRQMLDAALDDGITFLDTSNIYGPYISEQVIGAWLASRRPNVTIATKGGITRNPDKPVDNSEAYMRAELEGSLERLGTDHIALYYAHRRDPDMSPEEIAGIMSRFVEEGKIGGYGLSEVAPSTIRRAHATYPCMAVQNEYSLWTRLPELGVTQTCAELCITFVAFSPLARGMLTDTPPDPAGFENGDFRKPMPRFSEEHFATNIAQIDAFREYCRAIGHTTSAVALAWLLDQGDNIVPIPGTRTAMHLRDWADASTLKLSAEDREAINRLLPAGFAHGDRYSEEQSRSAERYC